MQEGTLTPKQERFVSEWIVDCNGSRAAIAAGFSPRSSRQIAAEYLAKPNIQRAIAERQEQLGANLEITQERVLRELARIAFGDARDAMEWSAGRIRVKDSAELTDAAAAMIAEVSEIKAEHGTSHVRLKLHSKTEALRQLARHLGLFPEQNSTYVDARSVHLHVDEAIAAILEARQRISEGAKALPAAPVVTQGDD